jgi:transposase
MLLWDSGKPHRHREVRRYLATHRHWHVVWLPPYAPELQPQEQVWNHFKYGRLANFAPDALPEICRAVWRELRLMAHRPALLKNLFRHSTLPFRV